MSIIAEMQPSRQGYESAVMCVAPGIPALRPGEVQLAWYGPVSLVGFKVEKKQNGAWVSAWLNCAVEYARPGGAAYQISFAALVRNDVEDIFGRSCSCADWQKRQARGAKPGSAAAECKHLAALGALLGGGIGLQHPLFQAHVDCVCQAGL